MKTSIFNTLRSWLGIPLAYLLILRESMELPWPVRAVVFLFLVVLPFSLVHKFLPDIPLIWMLAPFAAAGFIHHLFATSRE